MKPSAKLVVFGALLGGVSFASGAFAEPLVRARSAHFSLPTKAKFSPLLRRRFLARCRMDWCHWVSLENVHLIGRSSKGELYAVNQKWWTSGPHKNWAQAQIKLDETNTSFVFCSKIIPASIRPDGKNGYLIYPGTGVASGPAETIYVAYWAACHRSATTEAGMDTELAKRFGYQLSKP